MKTVVKENRMDLSNEIIAKGADLNLTDNEGKTALILAIES